ncbi:MAG: hypothetical protein ACQR33_00365 [Candidatus Saccharibacteria bacterium]
MDNNLTQDEDWQNDNREQDGLFNPQIDQEKLDEDNASPAAPPQFEDDEHMPIDHPNTDTDMDEGGVYLGGRADEAGYAPTPEDHDTDMDRADLLPDDNEDADRY